MDSIGREPDATVDHPRSRQKQSRITNGAGITMVGAAVGRRRQAARPPIFIAQFSRMAVCCGA